MAISFSRPDPSSPSSVAEANFPTSRRGFDQQEVREFLRTVATEMARMQDRERFLEGEMRSMRQQRAAVPTELDDEALARLVGEETVRIVQAARESSTAIRLKAEDAAERLLREAREEAQALRAEAEQEAARRRKDAETDAEAELAMAKQQGREMVEEARAYRERALGELSRRRDLARQQIDQLVHGRDRLVQAFERARLVAADVVAELVPLGELDEYVNLSPTTGPVPVMVPASRLADASAISDDALAMRAKRDEAESAAASTPPASATSPPSDDTRAIDRTLAGDATGNDTETTEDADVATGVGDADDADPETGDPGTGNPESGNPESGNSGIGDPGTGVPGVGESATAGRSGATTGSADAPISTVGGARVLQFPGGTRGDFARSTNDTADDSAAGADEDDEPEPAPATGEEIDDDEVTATDVDHLFARLRGRDDADEAGGEADDATAGAADDEIDRSEPVDAADDPAGSPFDRRNEALTPLIVASGRKLKRVLADEQNTILARLRRKDPVRALADVVAEPDDHGARYFDAIADDVMAAAEAGAESLGGATLDAGDDGVLGAVRQALFEELIAPLRERITGRIDDGDGDNDAITKSVRSIYREWKTHHIDEQLDDLLRLAYGRGAYAALASGEPCRWVFDPEVGPCSDCEDNSLQGDVAAGTAFPTGHVAPPAHSGCRCLVARRDVAR